MRFSSNDREFPEAGFLSDPVVRKLSAFAPLDGEDLELLHGLRSADRCAPGRTIHSPSSPYPRLRFLLSGWAARQRLLTDGRRQILSLVLPGDAIGLGELDRPANGVSVVALTACETIDAPFVAAGAVMRGSPTLSAALAGAEALDQWLMVEQVVRLGRRTALERSAHLLLEIDFRLSLAGLRSGDRFSMPLTQEVLSDVLGLSVVHVNRTLLQLRRQKWIDLHNRQVELLRRAALAALADFQPPIDLVDPCGTVVAQAPVVQVPS